ncbi:MAG TPA: hypothetical protein VFQ77_08510 [Pseudonocardiaceae bacterium]|nr:hypothetical protein [Pseudonocardiaceae bacterium]
MIREPHCHALVRDVCHVLVCDVCGESSDRIEEMVDQHFPSAESARSEGRLYGWSRHGGRDVCPACLGWVLSDPGPAEAPIPGEGLPTGEPGTVYLLHFDRPYRHARHYLGWAADLQARLAAHAAGRGPPGLQVITGAGIGYTLARTWPGTRTRERQLKRQGGRSRCCPLCGITPRPTPTRPTPTRTGVQR